MTRKSYTTALALYRSRTFSLEEAAAYSGVSEAKVTASLRSHGITVREEPTSDTAKTDDPLAGVRAAAGERRDASVEEIQQDVNAEAQDDAEETGGDR